MVKYRRYHESTSTKEYQSDHQNEILHGMGVVDGGIEEGSDSNKKKASNLRRSTSKKDEVTIKREQLIEETHKELITLCQSALSRLDSTIALLKKADLIKGKQVAVFDNHILKKAVEKIVHSNNFFLVEPKLIIDFNANL